MKALFSGDDDNAKIKKSLLLGQEYLGGNWNSLQKEEIEIRKILGGLSNLLHLVSTNSKKLSNDEPRKFLVRTYCQSNSPLQVAQDTVVFSVLAERGLGPKIYGFFEGGRLEEFLESRTFNNDDLRVEENCLKIGASFRKFHSLQLPISKKPQTFIKMREWLEEFRKLGGESHEIIPSTLNYPNIPKRVTIADIENELNLFEEMSTIFDDTIVFSHNDLAPANILELNNTKEVTFIDFEYSFYNWRGFDLGTHLAEYAFDYRTKVSPFYTLDASIFENHPMIRPLCSSYLNSPSCDDLMDECRFFWPLSNMFYGIWSLLHYTAGFDTGTDLRAATSDRLAFYFHLKNRAIAIYEKRKHKMFSF